MSGADGEPDWTDGVIGHTRAGLRANRENPVWRLTWGREPASPRRRRRAWIALVGPSAVSLLLFLSLLSYMKMDHRFASADNIVFFAALLTSLMMTPLVLIRRVMAPVPSLLRPESRDELTMAGLTGRDRLWGANSPGLCGVALAGLAQVVLLPLFFTYSFMGDKNVGHAEYVFLMLFFITLPTFLMVAGAFLEAALRGLTLSRLARAAGIGALIFGLGVWCVVAACICLPDRDSRPLLPVLLFFGEFVAVAVVISFWYHAELRLEGPSTAFPGLLPVRLDSLDSL